MNLPTRPKSVCFATTGGLENGACSDPLKALGPPAEAVKTSGPVTAELWHWAGSAGPGGELRSRGTATCSARALTSSQLLRDDYDKKVKQAAKEKARRRHTPAPTRPRKPDRQVYLPRRRDGSTHPSNPDCEESGESSSSGGSEPEPSGRQLFCLEYEADSGEVTSVIVYQDRALFYLCPTNAVELQLPTSWQPGPLQRQAHGATLTEITRSLTVGPTRLHKVPEVEGVFLQPRAPR
ncbi:UPF0561 protein C2orf68 homolog isoform X2 [Pteropus vampyrus]|uniref:UPF0561 protein C2orf68 homolog isoform X2 n=1 Tax=Pteropus vampyrus TaxID=132908 RepID=A0A6P6CXZ3_PTEVA|nr:UPF0561 protein C2orf68 homolog isoform X2 [Pteropus vampyrus]